MMMVSRSRRKSCATVVLLVSAVCYQSLVNFVLGRGVNPTGSGRTLGHISTKAGWMEMLEEAVGTPTPETPDAWWGMMETWKMVENASVDMSLVE